MRDEVATVLFFCEHTIGQQARSGIQRVVIEAARALAPRVDLRFVKWDRVDGQLRYLDVRDLRRLFGPDWHRWCEPHPACHKVGYRFGDTLEQPERSWLLMPEIPYFLDQGNRTFAKMLAQCREDGVRVASIFYDLIPVREAAYGDARSAHLEYLLEVLRCDRVFTISKFSADDLLDFLQGEARLEPELLEGVRDRVVPAPLGEVREHEAWGLPLASRAAPDHPLLVMVGTVEPRKQQVRLLKVLNDAIARHPELAALEVEVYGSLHPASAEALATEIARNPRIRHHQYVPDAVLEDAYSRAWFSAFVSNHEGYGLPIVESVRRGVPCITASFGAMAEVAAGGGCLLVDVNDDRALEDALVRMVGSPALRQQLHDAIAERAGRSWGDYADGLVRSMGEPLAQEAGEEQRLAQAVQAAARGGEPLRQVAMHGVTWTIAASAARADGDVSDRAGGRSAVLRLADGDTVREPSRELALAFAHADVIACLPGASVPGIVEAARVHEIDELLPEPITQGDNAISEAIAAAVRLGRERGRALRVAGENRLYGALWRRFGAELPRGFANFWELAIVISTFNRADFVERNVEWLLRELDSKQLPVQVHVVDNASTDDTFDRMQRFVGHPRFRFTLNANNTGMLGNLRVCSTVAEPPYVWLVGDDDFIVPGAVERTLEVLRTHGRPPLLVHNFSVYHRAKLSPTDSPEQFLAEQIRLAPNPRPSGLRPVNALADEHDNLFTAIYPLVFRSDVLAACFNHPFTGTPFGDLTESVPTTRMILGRYRYADAHWFAETGIVGNAHNSWSSHRPRWHLVLMPRVLQLAREAGVDPKKCWPWTRLHKQLFDEAVGISVANGVPAHIALPKDAELAGQNFREEVRIDPALAVVTAPQPLPAWRPAGR